MNAPKHNNNLDGEFVTVNQMATIANLGTASVRRIANESGAALKIGRSYRINRKKFIDYVATTYQNA